MTEIGRERISIGVAASLVGLLVVLIGHTVAISWWASRVSSHLELQADRNVQQDASIRQLEQSQILAAAEAGRVGERLAAQATTLSRIERLLEQQYGNQERNR